MSLYLPPRGAYKYVIDKLGTDTVAEPQKSGLAQEKDASPNTVFQAVVDNLSDGECVWLMPNTYTFTSAVDIDKPIQFYCGGWTYEDVVGSLSGTIIETASDINMFELKIPSGTTRLNDVLFSNVAFDHTHATSTKAVFATNFTTQTHVLKRFTLDKAYIHTSNAKGLAIQSQDVLHMWQNYLRCSNTALEIVTENFPSGNIKLVGNTFVPLKDNVTLVDLADTAGVSGTISRFEAFFNQFWMTTTRTGCTSIKVTKGNTGSMMSGFEIVGNDFEHGLYAVYLDGTDATHVVRLVTIEDNYSKNTENPVEAGQKWMYFGQHTRGIKAVHNHFLGAAGSGSVGIDDDNADTSNPNVVGFNDFVGVDTEIQPSATTRIFQNNPYNPIGNVVNPYPVAAGNLVDAGGAQAFPTNNTNYTVTNSPKLITIYGGTVTSISVDGVASGLTSGAFTLNPGQVLNVVWTVQPSSSVYAM